MKTILQINKSTVLILAIVLFSTSINGQTYKIVDTNQENCYDTIVQITPPSPGNPYYGQDAQYNGNQPSYQDNGDGTVTDLVTGLMWQKNLFTDKYTYDESVAGVDTCTIGSFDDWRLPSIKELYSLIQFSGYGGTNEEESIPFINTNYFEFRYGDESAGERFIDSQNASSTTYVGTTMNGNFTMFGVNFADGRIKGYGTEPRPGQTEGKLFEVRYVRGSIDYGVNDFLDNNDGTITDLATDLMWTTNDNEEGLIWEDALALVQQKNNELYLGHNDWRLPNAKELQSIIDYSRSLQTTNSAAIDPLFEASTIIDEGGEINYPFYWTGTTHLDGPPNLIYTNAVYLCFGEALGFMEMPPNSGNYVLMDVHGAGAQRSDPKVGDPDNYPFGHGPQGDVIRIYNYVRLVRDAESTAGIIDKNNTDESLVIYPNPVTNIMTVKFENSVSSDIKIINMLGHEYSINKKSNTNTNELKIYVGDLVPGVYTMITTSENTAITKKFIIR